MANSKLVTVDVLAYNNEKIKEQLDKKINIQQDVADANKILGIGVDGVVTPIEAHSSVKVSAESDNQIEQKQDGIYVKDMSAKISAEQDNALIEKQDGLYVPSVSETKVSEAEGNSIEVKDDGIYVAPTDLTNYVEKEEGKGLFSGLYNDLADKPIIPSVEGLVSEETLNITLADYVKTDELPDGYDDTALSNRVVTLETNLGSHTVKSDVPTNAVFTDTVYDDAALKTELTTAIATAKSEAIETILGEAVSEDFDTLQEVADWIQADTTSSAELIIRVTNAESDIDTLEETISNKVDKVDGKGLSTNDFTDTYQSDVDGNTNARHTHSNTTVLNNTTASYTTEEQEKLSGIKEGAESSVSTVTGDNPTINNSTDGNLIYLKNSGYTEQETLTGKNLLKNTATTRTVSGVTFIVNADRSITINGTATADTDIALYGSYDDTTNQLVTGEKTIKILKTDINGINILAGTGSTVHGISSKDSHSANIDTSTKKISWILLRVTNGITVSNKTLYPMIISSDETNTTYEPYCGGIASPNPDYPQRIGANVDKGYFDGELLQGYRGASDGVYAWDNRHVTNTNGIECKSGDIIKIKYEEIPERLNLVFYDKDNVHISGSYKDNVNEHEETAPENAKYVYFTVKQENITPSKAKHICVTINGQYALRVKTENKNLLKNTLTSQTVDGITFKVNEDGSVSTSGTATADIKLNFPNIENVFENGKTYHVSGITHMSINGTWCDALDHTFTKTENMAIELFYRCTTGNKMASKYYPQVELGDITTPYQPHQESTAIIPISSPLYDGDYLEVYADGSGKIVRESNLFYCKTIKSYDISRDISLLQFEITNTSDTKRVLAKCNSFIQKLAYNFSYEHFYIEGNVINLFIRKDRFSTGLGNIQSEFTSYIQSNPIYFVYYLATPTETPLTAEQVAEFKKLRTFNEVTNINADGTTTVRYYVNTDSGNTVGMLHEQIASVGSYIKALEERLTALENA